LDFEQLLQGLQARFFLWSILPLTLKRLSKSKEICKIFLEKKRGISNFWQVDKVVEKIMG